MMGNANLPNPGHAHYPLSPQFYLTIIARFLAGMGFFTDAYDLFSIPIVTGLLGRIYYQTPGTANPGSLPPNVNAAVNAMALIGTLMGQLFFGWLGEIHRSFQLCTSAFLRHFDGLQSCTYLTSPNQGSLAWLP